MATINRRTRKILSTTFNGVDAGGAMSGRFEAGYDMVLRSAPDGLGGPPLSDLYVEYVRGDLATQDFSQFLSLLTAAASSYVCYERKDGVAPASGYIKHTLTNPVAHTARLSISKDGYAVGSCVFECRPADESKGFADMWQITDEQSKPTYLAAARGGYRIAACSFAPPLPADPIPVYHLTGVELSIALQLIRESNDADVGYTCCDVDDEGGTYDGTVEFQDSSVAGGQLMAQQLISAGRGTLSLTLRSSGGAADKTVEIAGVRFVRADRSAAQGITSQTLSFEIVNDPTTPLSLTGDNKIITIS